MVSKVFLSYGHDRFTEDVLQIKSDLELKGHEVWFDAERLKAGVDWEAYIDDGLRWCDRVIVVMTPHSVRRRGGSGEPAGFCLNEIAKAIQLRKPIIPILLAPLNEGPPLSICNLQYLDFCGFVPLKDRRAPYLAAIDDLVESLAEPGREVEGGLTRLRRYLQPMDFDSEMSRHVATFVGRGWLFQELDAWINRTHGSGVFWIVGTPGVGKSAISAHLCHERADVAASHFCVHGNADKTNARRLILSVVYQLAIRLPSFRAALDDLPIEDESAKDAQTICDNLLVTPIVRAVRDGTLAPPTSPILVVIDGLDEATDAAGRNEIAAVVGRSWNRLPDWLKLIITSRPESDVSVELQTLNRLQPFLINARGEEHREDALKFVKSALTNIRPDASPDLGDRLVDLSEGSFLYLTVVLKEIAEGRRDVSDLRSFPQGMGGYYQQFFERRCGDLGHYREHLRPFIAAIIAQRAPLPISLLAEAARKSSFETEDELQRLGSLFPLRREGSDIGLVVTTLHKSLRDWLTDKDVVTHRFIAGSYAVDLAIGEASLAEACWARYLSCAGNESRYAVLHLMSHLAACGKLADLEKALTDSAFLKVRNAMIGGSRDSSEAPARLDESALEAARLEEALAARPDDVMVLFDLGVLRTQRGEWQEAVRRLRQALELAPAGGRPAVLTRLSFALTQGKESSAAIECAEEAVRTAGTPSAFLALGLALESTNQTERAIAAYSEGLRAHPQDEDLRLTLGNLLGKSGDLPRAVCEYQTLLGFDPSHLYGLSNLAYALQELSQFDEALKYFRRAVEVAPNDATAWYDLGDHARKCGKLSDAIECFRKSFELDPKFYRNCLSLALALEDDDQREGAVVYYARAMSLTDDRELQSAVARQMTRMLEIKEDLASTFEPAVALEYAELWLKVRGRPS